MDATGRCVRSDKRGFIPPEVMPALDRLPLRSEQWLELVLDIQSASLQAIGAMSSLRRYQASTGRQWLCGARRLGRIYGVA